MGEEVFHQYAVLGKVEIENPAERVRIIAKFQQAIEKPDGAHKCFWPRHALVAREHGKTFEIAICFQCRQFFFYGDSRNQFCEISRSAEPVLTKHLADAGILLAP